MFVAEVKGCFRSKVRKHTSVLGMEAVLYSWLSAATIAPFVAILSAWTLVVFWSYRHRWRLVDLFLFSLTAHEIFSALFGFGFAVLSLIRPFLDAPCCSIVWGLAATRTFHISVVTSLILERAITVRKSHTFRASMRRSHVRYHIAVLATIAVIVGMTSVFARVSSNFNGFCSLHPLAWNIQFSVFTVSVYGILLLAGLVGFILVQVKQVDDQESKQLPGLSWDSGRSTSTSNSSRQLKTEWSECQNLEWRAVACICWLSYVTNHGPFVAMTVMGLAVPTFWSPWLDNATIWLRLAQGCLVPLVLVIFDLPHRSALRNMLRQRGRIYRHLSDSSGFRLKIEDFKYSKDGILPPLRLFTDNGGRPFLPLFQTPMRRRWSPHNLPNLHMFHPERTLHRIPNLHSFQRPSFTRWNVPASEPRSYDTLGSFCSLSLPSSEDKLFYSSADDVGSITTDAFDDFDFLAGSSRHVLGYGSRSVLSNAKNNSVYPHLCTIFPKLFDINGGINPGNSNEVESSVTGYAGKTNGGNDASKSSVNLLEVNTTKENIYSDKKNLDATPPVQDNFCVCETDHTSLSGFDKGISPPCLYHDFDTRKRFGYPSFSSVNNIIWANPLKLYSEKKLSPCCDIYNISNSSDAKQLNGSGAAYLSGGKENADSPKSSSPDLGDYAHIANETYTRQRILFSEYL